MCVCVCVQKSKSTVEENETLKSTLQEAEAVQMQTNSAEQDYEEVIRLLEAEIKDLKEQLAEKKHTSLQLSNVSKTPKVGIKYPTTESNCKFSQKKSGAQVTSMVVFDSRRNAH